MCAKGSSPSVDDLTATNRSKFSSTRTRIASERESIAERRCALPARRSWYVASGCTAERKALGSKDFDEINMEASVYE